MEQSMNRRALLVGVAAGLTAPLAARAQQAPSPIARANANVVGVISGGLDGTYTRFAADLAAVLDEVDGLRILPIIGKGSFQNLSDLLYLRGVDVAIVQSDVLAAAAQQNAFPGIAQHVQYITKLYDEEVHIFARQGVEQLSDLAGKLVSMDNRGSGTAMTATLLFSRLGIAVQPVYDPTVDATEKLRRGDIAAMVRVTGKPARFTTPLPEGTRLLAVPLSESLLETYLPASFTAADYPALVPAGETVDTVAVGAVLAAYNHQNADRRDRVVRFSRALSLKFDSFTRPPRHPKWRDVNLTATVPGWTKFGASERPSPPSRQPRRYRGTREAIEG
jgi:uncharacterized protein